MIQEPLLQLSEHPHIEGWGVDLNPEDRPAVPKERTPPRFIHPHWNQPEPQMSKQKVFHSTERPSLTPVFGTTVPPSGLSGLLRKFAFRFSENDLRHWLTLLFADRIHVLEGIGNDLLQGQIPNILAEMGIKAEWKYNRKGLIKKVLIGLGITSLVALKLKKLTQKNQGQSLTDFYVD